MVWRDAALPSQGASCIPFACSLFRTRIAACDAYRVETGSLFSYHDYHMFCCSLSQAGATVPLRPPPVASVRLGQPMMFLDESLAGPANGTLLTTNDALREFEGGGYFILTPVRSKFKRILYFHIPFLQNTFFAHGGFKVCHWQGLQISGSDRRESHCRTQREVCSCIHLKCLRMLYWVLGGYT